MASDAAEAIAQEIDLVIGIDSILYKTIGREAGFDCHPTGAQILYSS